jgi:hypothetical protein
MTGGRLSKYRGKGGIFRQSAVFGRRRLLKKAVEKAKTLPKNPEKICPG